MALLEAVKPIILFAQQINAIDIALLLGVVVVTVIVFQHID
jgi:hypothetical protein